MTPWLLTLAILHGADAATTHVAIARGVGQEAWLPVTNPYAIDAVVAGETVLEWRALTRLEKAHPRLARGLALSSMAVRATVVAWNLRELHR